MRSALETIQLLVAPVVMISACGLLCLALYNRLTAIVSRARAFLKERFDAEAKLSAAGAVDTPATQILRQRVATLDLQVEQILRRARLVRNSVICLLLTVLCMLGCSIVLGLSIFAPGYAGMALGLFSLGVAAMIGAVVLALAELVRALDPVLLEQTAVEELEPEG